MTRLLDLLQEERELVSCFITCLHDEASALGEIRPEALAEIGQKKTDLTHRIDALERQRNQMTGGNARERGRMADWLATHPDEAAAADVWNEIMTLATEARRLHEVNGELIALHLRKTTEAIEILSQRQNDKPLYGSDGQSTGSSGSRIVDSA